MKSFIVVLGLTLLSSLSAKAQDSGEFIKPQRDILQDTRTGLSAYGKVLSEDEGTPIAGVPLEVIGPEGSIYTFTDNSGVWSLYNLPEGNYTVAPVPMAPPNINDDTVGEMEYKAEFKVERPSYWDFFSNNEPHAAQNFLLK